jgi:hypothetical protein
VRAGGGRRHKLRKDLEGKIFVLLTQLVWHGTKRLQLNEGLGVRGCDRDGEASCSNGPTEGSWGTHERLEDLRADAI